MKTQELSHSLPTLRVYGNRIVNDQTLEPVILRGVNRSGLEYSSPNGEGSLAKANITEDEIAEITDGWNANIIRLPFNQDWALERSGYDPTPYRNAIEAVVEMAARRGAYTLLDLQWLDARTPRGTVNDRANFVPPLPNLDSITLWLQLARLWRNEPAILYDIFNEPHDALPDDPEPLLGIHKNGSTFQWHGRKVGSKQWRPWASHLISAIRSQHPDALIFVPGTDWAFNLAGLPIRGVADVVYSTHVYTSKSRDWDRAFGDLSQSNPVFAGEWGGGEEHLEWGSELERYFEEHGIGWAAWSWSDEPRLVAHPPEPPFEPTKFGALVRRCLRERCDEVAS